MSRVEASLSAVHEMRITLLVTLTLLTAAAIRADERKFSAADVPMHLGTKKSGKIVISNDSTSITASRFLGNIREALVSIRSLPNLVTRNFGSVLFDSSAKIETPMPSYMAVIMAEAGRAHGVDPRLIAAVAHRESAFNPNAVSAVGAGGLMQLMPATARYLGCDNVFDARKNVFAGARYLRTLLDTFHGDLDLTLAAYNAGPGAVQKYNGVPPYRETRAYIAAIRANYEHALRGY